MMGAAINVVPFMIHRSVPDIGPYVIPAMLFAALPALLAAFAYASLSSAMPRAGGSYLYASRGLHPYLGFVASFSQWFGLSIVIGVVSYLIVPFIRDVLLVLEYNQLAATLMLGSVRVPLALLLLWTFVGVNVLGGRFYERILIPMMVLMFTLGGIVVISGLFIDPADFLSAWELENDPVKGINEGKAFSLPVFFSAAAVLFSSFIGFDSIAQAGSEAKNPTRNLPLAIVLAIGTVGTFYLLFAASMYHMVPWQLIAAEAQAHDISAPGLLRYVLPAGLGVAILSGAVIALINDLPAMLLAVSRLMFAWAEDGIFPRPVTRTHPKYHTPYVALVASGSMATIGVLGSHFAGDFFLGVDIMVTSMMMNFLLICLSLLAIPYVNPRLARQVTVLRRRKLQVLIGGTGTLLLIFFLIIHTHKDLTAEVEAWYFRSTPVWLMVMSLASIIFFFKLRQLKNEGTDTNELFTTLPPE